MSNCVLLYQYIILAKYCVGRLLNCAGFSMIILWEYSFAAQNGFPDFNCNMENNMCAKKNEE